MDDLKRKIQNHSYIIGIIMYSIILVVVIIVVIVELICMIKKSEQYTVL
jgi:hypothetical protein